MDASDIEMRDMGYRNGESGITPIYPDSEPYMDGWRLGDLVRTANKAQAIINKNGNPHAK